MLLWCSGVTAAKTLFCQATRHMLRFYMYFLVCRFSNVCGEELLRHDGSGSGGYLHHVYTHAAKQLFGVEVEELTYKTLK